ncbi:unnamed protein product, partial [Thlaspi arvense]
MRRGPEGASGAEVFVLHTPHITESLLPNSEIEITLPHTKTTTMSATDIIAIPANANFVTFDDLRRSTQQVIGRLLRFWDARNIKKNGEYMGIVLLLLDEKLIVSTSLNSIFYLTPISNSGCDDQYRPQLREDAIFNIEGFEVGRCTKLYKITDHPFVLRFLASTTIAEMHVVSPTIKHERFMLRNIDHLQALANPNLELPDVVGQICFIQGLNLDDPTSTQHLVAYLTTGDTMHSVMVVTNINPKLFGGNLYLNSTPATRFFFDNTIHAIQQFTTRMGIQSIEPFVQTETKDGIRKKEAVSIAKLNDFISKSNEQRQEADFVCKACVLGVLQRNGWSYVSCAAYSRKLSKSGTNLKCNKCISWNFLLSQNMSVGQKEKDFSKWILQVGDGVALKANQEVEKYTEEESILIDDNLLIPETDKPLEKLCKSDLDKLKESAILKPRNET